MDEHLHSKNALLRGFAEIEAERQATRRHNESMQRMFASFERANKRSTPAPAPQTSWFSSSPADDESKSSESASSSMSPETAAAIDAAFVGLFKGIGLVALSPILIPIWLLSRLGGQDGENRWLAPAIVLTLVGGLGAGYYVENERAKMPATPAPKNTTVVPTKPPTGQTIARGFYAMAAPSTLLKTASADAQTLGRFGNRTCLFVHSISGKFAQVTTIKTDLTRIDGYLPLTSIDAAGAPTCENVFTFTKAPQVAAPKQTVPLTPPAVAKPAGPNLRGYYEYVVVTTTPVYESRSARSDKKITLGEGACVYVKSERNGFVETIAMGTDKSYVKGYTFKKHLHYSPKSTTCLAYR